MSRTYPVHPQKEEHRRLMTDPSYRPEVSRDVANICSILDIKSPNTHYRWLREYERGNGEFDLRKALNDNKEELFDALMKAVKNGRPNSQILKLFTQLTGDLVDRKEESIRVDFTPTDRIRIGAELRDHLRREWETTGNCPVCGQCKALRHEVCVDSKSELPEDREVATLGLPAGLD